MRWRFPDPADLEEAAKRQRIQSQIQTWWQAFEGRVADLEALFASADDWDLPAWMQSSLQAIDPNLMWEYGPAAKGLGHRLVVTPEAHRHLRPLVDQILASAPQVRGWEFYGHRPPCPIDEVVETVRGICGGDVSKTVVDVRHDGFHRVSLTYYCPECPEVDADDSEVQLAAFVATESLLGESVLDRWIGTIKVAPLDPAEPRGHSARAIPFARLAPTVEAVIGSLVEQLPDRPCFKYVPQGKWSSYELAPEQAGDYGKRDDLFVAISGRPDVFEAMHGGGVFYSDTHSRAGEMFCYLKLDGGGESASMRAHHRERIENRLDEMLIGQRLGCVVGGGTGLRYSYIDLALTDVQKAAQAIRVLAPEMSLPKRSWLLFGDDELRDEWLALSSSAPPPPSSM